jgi:signal transduction histidine kinase
MARPHKPAWVLRAPRRTLRLQLTLLYAGPFLLSGVALLTIVLLQTKVTAPPGLQPNPGPAPSPGTDLHRLLTASAVGLAVMVVIALVLGWLVAGRFLRPLRTITATARDISASNLHRRLSLGGRDDEFTELAATLDDLFGRLEASFASQRRFVANASHELRTPLTAERTLLQVALTDPDATAETLRSTCQDVLALGQQQERLIEALLTLASSERGIEQREPFDLGDIAGNVVLARQPEAKRRGIRVDTTLAPAPVAGDPSLVESLVANLVDNALRHNAAGGRIEIATTTTAGRARITVRNTGPVVPPGEVERLFQPFQQLGGERIRHTDGHGLGLAIVHAIASAHGATLIPRARPEGGLDIDVSFPDTGTGSAIAIPRP